MPLLTIVFTDVVGSSATKRDASLGRDSRERDHAHLEKVQTRHFEVVRASILLLRDDLAGARQTYEEALKLANDLHVPAQIALCNASLANLALQQKKISGR